MKVLFKVVLFVPGTSAVVYYQFTTESESQISLSETHTLNPFTIRCQWLGQVSLLDCDPWLKLIDTKLLFGNCLCQVALPGENT